MNEYNANEIVAAPEMLKEPLIGFKASYKILLDNVDNPERPIMKPLALDPKPMYAFVPDSKGNCKCLGCKPVKADPNPAVEVIRKGEVLPKLPDIDLDPVPASAASGLKKAAKPFILDFKFESIKIEEPTPEQKKKEAQRKLDSRRRGHIREIESTLRTTLVGRDYREVKAAASHIIRTELGVRFPDCKPSVTQAFRVKVKDNIVQQVRFDKRYTRSLGDPSKYSSRSWDEE